MGFVDNQYCVYFISGFSAAVMPNFINVSKASMQRTHMPLEWDTVFFNDIVLNMSIQYKIVHNIIRK